MESQTSSFLRRGCFGINLGNGGHVIHLETDKCTSVTAMHVSFCVLLCTHLHPSHRHFQESSRVLWLLGDYVCGTLGKQCVHPGCPEQSLQSFMFPSSLGMLGIEPGTVHSWGLLYC